MHAESEYSLIGREHELEALANVFATARREGGQAVLVAGEAGSGKSRLVETAVAAQGCRAFVARAREESRVAYGPLIAVLRECLRHVEADLVQREAALSPLASLLPELAGHDENVEPEALLTAIIDLLTRVTGDGCFAVVLDDLHWADNATMEILPALTERLHHVPGVVIGTYLTDDITRGHALRRVRTELRRTRRLHEIALEALTGDQTARLIERTLREPPSPGLVAMIHARTQGIPLFIEELSRAMVAGGHLKPEAEGLAAAQPDVVPIPESIRDAVLLRLDRLSESARALLEIAAVAGSEFDLSLVGRIGNDETGFDELFERQFIVETEPGRAAFRHTLLAEACRAEISWSRRRSLHREVGEALAAAGAPPEIVAEHWLAAQEQEKARSSLLASADRSCRIHAYRDAAQAAHRALEIWPEGEAETDRLQVLERVAHCSQLGGQLTDAIKAWREIIESPQLATDARRRGDAYRSLATVYALQGAWEQGIEARRAAAASLQEAGAMQEAAVEWLAAAGRLMATAQLTAAIEAAGTAAELAELAGTVDIQARALGLQGEALATRGEFELGRDKAQAGLSLALKANDTEATSDVYRRLANALTSASDYTGARQVFTTALDFCRTNDVSVHAQICLSCLSYVLFMNGDWKQALEVCDEVIQSEHTPPGSAATGYGIKGLVEAYRGDTRKARFDLQQAMSEGRKRNIVAMEMLSSWGLGIVEENDQAWEAAERYYQKLLAGAETTEDRHDVIAPLWSAVTFFAERGKLTETSRGSEVLAEIASATASSEALSALAYALGLTALLNDDPASARQQFEQSLSHLEKLEIPIARAMIARQFGRALVRQGDPAAGVKQLRTAYRIARKLGARPLAGRLAAEIETLGESVEDRRGSEMSSDALIQSLTGRQLEVARLMAGGLTNKEIAAKLFVSPRTVDMHVANILSRLDCKTRTEAVTRAVDLGLLSTDS